MSKKHSNENEKPVSFDSGKTVLAAGAVMYRLTDAGDIEVAVVHRPRYDDWSLPKGKLDRGEALPVTARRELLEETGHECILGQSLGESNYRLKNGAFKRVWYWAARETGGEFVASDECDRMDWLSVSDAVERVSYELDQSVLATFRSSVAPHADRLRQVVLIRHARAGDRNDWKGDDARRPLDKKGLLQAEYLAPQLRAFGVTNIVTAEPDRCIQTVAPLAEGLGITPLVDHTIGDIGASKSPKSAVKTLMSFVDDGVPDASGTITVLSSQGTAIPLILERLTKGTTMASLDFSTKKSGQWTLSFADGKLVDAGYLPRPLPLS